MGVPFALHRVSMCPTKRRSISLAILLPCRETDPANNMSLNMVCDTCLYQSIWSLVGNWRERVGLRHVRTPICVVIMTVRFAHSGNHPMGTVLRKQICPLRLVLMLDIGT
jgi:hypothetical protein